MFKKYLPILKILLIIAVFIIQQSLITKINWRFNFWPLILVFILFVFNYKLSLLWGLVAGFLLDASSTLFFGTYLLSLFLIIFIIYFLSKNFITNRSFLSFMILVLISTLFYNLFFYLFSRLTPAGQLAITHLNTILVQILSNLILGIILFMITLFFSKKLKTNLIINQ